MICEDSQESNHPRSVSESTVGENQGHDMKKSPKKRIKHTYLNRFVRHLVADAGRRDD